MPMACRRSMGWAATAPACFGLCSLSLNHQLLHALFKSCHFSSPSLDGSCELPIAVFKLCYGVFSRVHGFL
jgi:hypothetical protein